MRGSEKQIKWAEDIKVNVLAIISDAIAFCKSSSISNEQKERFIGQMNTLKYNIENVAYAGDLIEVFKDTKHSGDCKQDISDLRSALRWDVNKIFSKSIK